MHQLPVETNGHVEAHRLWDNLGFAFPPDICNLGFWMFGVYHGELEVGEGVMFGPNVIVKEASENVNKVEEMQGKSQADQNGGVDRRVPLLIPEIKGGLASCGSVYSLGSRFHL